jgi:hypothetical protein
MYKIKWNESKRRKKEIKNLLRGQINQLKKITVGINHNPGRICSVVQTTAAMTTTDIK